jgi:acetolactate synthase I/II/III large subunit
MQRRQGDKLGDVAGQVRLRPANFADLARAFDLRGEVPPLIGPDETVVADTATDIDCRAPEPWLPEEVQWRK